MTNLYGFDANGNQVAFTNPLWRVTTNVFDVLNRQVQVQYPDGTKTLTGYDNAGRRVKGSSPEKGIDKRG